MQSIEDKIARGEQIGDPKVKRYSLLMGVIRAALKSITGQDFPSHKLWMEWWSKNKSTFKVLD